MEILNNYYTNTSIGYDVDTSCNITSTDPTGGGTLSILPIEQTTGDKMLEILQSLKEIEMSPQDLIEVLKDAKKEKDYDT